MRGKHIPNPPKANMTHFVTVIRSDFVHTCEISLDFNICLNFGSKKL